MAPKTVKVYTTPTWPYCKTVKSFLTSNSIPFTELDVTTNRAYRDEMIGKSGKLVVPQIEVDGEMVVGFNEAVLKEKLGLK